MSNLAIIPRSRPSPPSAGEAFMSIKLDGVVKSPIYIVVDFSRQLNIPHVWMSHRLKHYSSYIKLFS